MQANAWESTCQNMCWSSGTQSKKAAPFAIDSIDPIRHEYVRLVRIGIVPIGSPNELLAIRAEHRESVERRRGGHLLEPRPIGTDQKQVEVAQLWIGVMVRRENDSLAIGRPRWPEARRAEMGDLPLVASVRVHYPQVHFVRTNQPLGEKILVARHFRFVRWVIRTIDDLLSIW